MSLAQKKDFTDSRFNLIDLAEYDLLMEMRGWVVFESAIAGELVDRMLADMEKAYKICRGVQVKNGIADNTEFTVHHLIGMKGIGDSFLKYLEVMPIKPYIERYFGGKYILNSFGGAINTVHSRSYAHNIHRDVRPYSGSLPLLLNTLVMLDDFTEQNGPTLLMPGSHRTAGKPTPEEFFAKAEPALGKAGSILMFDSNVWHAGGDNKTDKIRRSVTPMFCKPYVKPQFDYPRALGYGDGDKFSPEMRQILGYNSRIPATLDEWYQPPEKRMYKPDQG